MPNMDMTQDFESKLLQFRNLIEKYPNIPSAVKDKILESISEIGDVAHTRLSLGILGEFSAGKSTFINLLLGKNIMQVSDKPTTPLPTIIRYGQAEDYYLIYNDESRKKLTQEQFHSYTDEATFKQDNAHYLLIETPSEILERLNIEIIDTPGVNSLNTEHTRRTMEFLPKMHAVVFLINARKPCPKTTIEFINQVKEYTQKFFWCVTKTNAVSEENARRIFAKLPEILEKECNLHIENVFGIGFQAVQDSKQKEFVGVESFTNTLSEFMKSEWKNVVASFLLKELERQELHIKENLKTDLTKMEKEFALKYNEEPIELFEGLKKIEAKMTQLITQGITTFKQESLRNLDISLNEIKEEALSSLKSAWFKTTLTIKVGSINSKIQKLCESTDDNIGRSLQEFTDNTYQNYERMFDKYLNNWDVLKNKVFNAMADRIGYRIKYTILMNTILAFIIGISTFALSNNVYTFTLIPASFLVLFFLSIIIKQYSLKLIKIKENHNWDLKKYVKYEYVSKQNFNGLENSTLSEIDKNTSKAAGIAIKSAIYSGHPALAAIGVGVSFIMNEFTGESKEDIQSKLILQITEKIDEVHDMYGNIYDETAIAMLNTLQAVIKLFKERYYSILISEFERKRMMYLIEKQPIEQLEMLFDDLNVLTFSN